MKDVPHTPDSAFAQKVKHVGEKLATYEANRSRTPTRPALRPGLELTPENLLEQTDYQTWRPVLQALQPFCISDQWGRLRSYSSRATGINSKSSPEIRYALDATCGWALEHNAKLTPERLLAWADSFSRLPTLLALREVCDVGEWYRLLGEEWSGFDNVWRYHGRLMAMFKSDNWVHVERMMTDEERAARDALPVPVTAYRGCHKHNQCGLSYSLDRDIAEKFPFRHRYRSAGQPLLVKAKIGRARAIVKLGREELEVIAINPSIISVEELTEQS